MTGEPSFGEWLDEEVAVNLSFSVTRREYYRRYFGPGADSRRIYEQDRRVLAELRRRGAISSTAP